MTVKDVLQLLHRYQSPVARSKLKFLTFFDKKVYLNAEIFFGFSSSEFINDNTFSLKDKNKNDRGTLRAYVAKVLGAPSSVVSGLSVSYVTESRISSFKILI